MSRLSVVINKLIQNQIPFYVYRLPDRSGMRLGYQLVKEVRQGSSAELLNGAGFLLSPFGQENSSKAYFIKGDIEIDPDLELDRLEAFVDAYDEDDLFSPIDQSVYIASKEEYLEQCKHYINEIKGGVLQKAILSRIVAYEGGGKEKAGSYYLLLEKSYASAFVFLVNIPGVTCWLGATPEKLLRLDGQLFSTVSLAGTQRWVEGYTQHLHHWSAKDLAEQDFVTEYIKKVFQDLAITHYAVSPLSVVRAGNVGHLLTTFSAASVQIEGRVADLIARLSPTPAICGTPKEEALKFILQTEKHDRAFYGGFLGPVCATKGLDLFVNLRSARLDDSRIYIFVGGGITASSDPEEEWNETCLKAQSILQAINE